MNSSRILSAFIAFSVAILAGTAAAAVNNSPGTENLAGPQDIICIPAPNSSLKHAIVNSSKSRQELNRMLAPIHSRSELTQYMNKHNKESSSPLNALAPNAKNRFLSSLRFNGQGLTTFSYADIRYLTASQVYKILSLFGVQQDTRLTGARVVTQVDEAIMSAPVSPLSMICIDPGGSGWGGSKDHKDYWCKSRATCETQQYDICTSNC